MIAITASPVLSSRSARGSGTIPVPGWNPCSCPRAVSHAAQSAGVSRSRSALSPGRGTRVTRSAWRASSGEAPVSPESWPIPATRSEGNSTGWPGRPSEVARRMACGMSPCLRQSRARSSPVRSGMSAGTTIRAPPRAAPAPRRSEAAMPSAWSATSRSVTSSPASAARRARLPSGSVTITGQPVASAFSAMRRICAIPSMRRSSLSSPSIRRAPPAAGIRTDPAAVRAAGRAGIDSRSPDVTGPFPSPCAAAWRSVAGSGQNMGVVVGDLACAKVSSLYGGLPWTYGLQSKRPSTTGRSALISLTAFLDHTG